MRGIDLMSQDNSLAILRDLTLEIHPGERVAILGPSGAGKTTLLSLLAGTRLPSRGCVEYDGRCLTKLNTTERRKIRRRIGKIYQDFRLVPQRTAVQNVLTGYLGFLPTWRTIFGFPRECHLTARRLLASVGLEERTDYQARRLSGGEQQRVALARALAQEPGLLLADEPTASLDYQAAQGILDEIERVAKRGVTVVAVMHDIEFAESFSPRAILLNEGRIVYDGTSRDLRATMERVLGWTRPAREAAATA